jgi:hypothetical protein
MDWNVCIYVGGAGSCIDVDGEIGLKNELKARCELGVEKCYPSGRKICNIRYKINGRRIGRISKSISCLGKNNWSRKECVEVHTRRKVERIKRNGEQEQNWYVTN